MSPAFYPLPGTDLPLAQALLADYDLPTADIEEVSLFALKDAHENLMGIIGLESFGKIGLLRSLAVMSHAQKTGMGSDLVRSLEATAANLGLQTLYLLTTTAAPFFRKLGYVEVARDKVPEAIRQTREFADLCPATAVVLQRSLDVPA